MGIGYIGGLNDVPLLSLLNKKIKKPVRTMVKGPSESGPDGQKRQSPLRFYQVLIEVKPYHSKGIELPFAHRFLEIPTVLSSLSTSDAKMKREM